jgi:hypothetical protein
MPPKKAPVAIGKFVRPPPRPIPPSPSEAESLFFDPTRGPVDKRAQDVVTKGPDEVRSFYCFY